MPWKLCVGHPVGGRALHGRGGDFLLVKPCRVSLVAVVRLVVVPRSLIARKRWHCKREGMKHASWKSILQCPPCAISTCYVEPGYLDAVMQNSDCIDSSSHKAHLLLKAKCLEASFSPVLSSAFGEHVFGAAWRTDFASLVHRVFFVSASLRNSLLQPPLPRPT